MNNRLIGYALLMSTLVMGMAHADTEQQYNRIRFQAQAGSEVANDEMRVVLVAHGEDKDPARLAEDINQTMAWALKTAKSVKSARVKTGSYRTYARYEKRIVKGWQADQELIIEGADFARIGILVGELQSRLQVRNMGFSVAPDTRELVEERLMGEALDAFKRRAELVRMNMQFERYKLVDLQISSGGGGGPRPVYRSQAMAMDSMAPAAVEGGETRIDVMVNGLIELH